MILRITALFILLFATAIDTFAITCYAGRHRLNPKRSYFSWLETSSNCPLSLNRLPNYHYFKKRHRLQEVIVKTSYQQCVYRHPDNSRKLITCVFAKNQKQIKKDYNKGHVDHFGSGNVHNKKTEHYQGYGYFY
ncbi:MAG: hypothetical protein HOE90_08415 [Bacteriovoracaceae bacterium]|jgi:hypothetical protein|nr:hypothetical protein [Bacteriovoracaceae bacterium]